MQLMKIHTGGLLSYELLVMMTSGEFLDEHHRVLLSRLASVGREITDSRLRTRDDLEGLYRKIVSYVLLRSGLGSPTDINTVREATGKLCFYVLNFV